jgi:hypothetical protein
MPQSIPSAKPRYARSRHGQYRMQGPALPCLPMVIPGESVEVLRPGVWVPPYALQELRELVIESVGAQPSQDKLARVAKSASIAPFALVRFLKDGNATVVTAQSLAIAVGRNFGSVLNSELVVFVPTRLKPSSVAAVDDPPFPAVKRASPGPPRPS